MPQVRRTRSAQYTLVAEYVFNFNDGVAYLSALNGPSVDSNLKANITDFGSQLQPSGISGGITYVPSAAGSPINFEVIALPITAQVIGGDVQVEVAYAGPTAATLTLGDAVTNNLYSGAIDLKTLGRTALTIPAEVTGPGATHAALGLDLRGALLYTAAAATAGRARVRLLYTLDGRANENMMT